MEIQKKFNKIDAELSKQGFITEQLKKSNDKFSRYLVFYKENSKKIFAIESSLTFNLNDVITDVPDLYFHVGEIENSGNSLVLMFFQFVEYTNSITQNILQIIEERKPLLIELENAKLSYSKWKKDNELLNVF